MISRKLFFYGATNINMWKNPYFLAQILIALLSIPYFYFQFWELSSDDKVVLYIATIFLSPYFLSKLCKNRTNTPFPKESQCLQNISAINFFVVLVCTVLAVAIGAGLKYFENSLWAALPLLGLFFALALAIWIFATSHFFIYGILTINKRYQWFDDTEINNIIMTEICIGIILLALSLLCYSLF